MQSLLLAAFALGSRTAGAVELCDGVDNDGDLLIDEGPALVGTDADLDGFSTAERLVEACGPAQVPATDCDDTNNLVRPGLASDDCNGIDSDCDGVVDDSACPCPLTVSPTRAWMVCASAASWAAADRACRAESRYRLATPSDRAQQVDLVAALGAAPGLHWLGLSDAAREGVWVWSDGAPFVDSFWAPGEPTGDTFGIPRDCAAIDPAGEWSDESCTELNAFVCEATCDPRTWSFDADGDGLGDSGAPAIVSCEPPDFRWVQNGLDCDDLDPSVPSLRYADLDGDGFGAGAPVISCDRTLADAPTDCDDGDRQVYPGRADLACDGTDQDCSGADLDPDDDGDGVSLCAGDCDDGDPDRAPGLVDVPDNGVDEDCDGSDATAAGHTGEGGGDADGDGIADDVEGAGDLDGDGIPNRDDLDSDGDGALDAAEGPEGAYDAGGVASVAAPAPPFGFGCDTGGGVGAVAGWLVASVLARRRPARR